MNTKQNLSQLVSELSKQQPDLSVVKTMCQKTGFTYSTDLIQLMSDILMNATHASISDQFDQNKNKNKNKTQDSARI